MHHSRQKQPLITPNYPSLVMMPLQQYDEKGKLKENENKTDLTLTFT